MSIEEESTIRVGLIGAGGNTRSRHLPGFRAIEGVDVIGVANRTEESSRRAAAEHGVPRHYATWRELINDPEIDAVCIGTWPNTHAAATMTALEAGKHVLCEARLARNLSEARQMLACAERHPGLITQVVPSPFTLNTDAKIIELISQGALGRVVNVDIIASAGFTKPDDPISWREDVEISGLNTMSLGIWYEALLRWLGAAERVFVEARTIVPIKPGPSGPTPVGVPDFLEILGRMAMGASLHMRISSVTSGGHNGISIFGTKGTLHVERKKITLQRSSNSDAEVFDFTEAGDGWQVEAEFVDSIRNGSTVKRTSFADGVRYMAFTEAVANSAASGQPQIVARL